MAVQVVLHIVNHIDATKAIVALDRYIKLTDTDARPSKAAAWWRKDNAYELLAKTNNARACYQQSLALEPAFDDAQKALQRMVQTPAG